MQIQYQNRLTLMVTIAGCCLISSAAVCQQPATVRVTTEPMCCTGCGQKIAGQFYTVPGVKSVSLDYATKTLTVVYQQGRTPSPRRLCEAVLKTDDHAVKVSGAFGTISLEYPQPGGAQQNAQPPYTTIVLEKLQSKEDAKRVAAQIYALKIVKSISLDLSHRELLVTPHDGQQVSVWVLWEAVERAGDHAVVIQGPSGTLKNDTLLTANRESPRAVR